MELNQLRYFQTVAKYQHMTRAAEELHISQSSLSKTIATLEADVGTNLFDRTGNRIVLNDVGRRFLSRVDRSLMELEDAVREASDTDSGSVAFATSISGLCTDYTTDFLFQNPNIRLKHYLMPAERMKDALESGLIDFALSFDNLTGEHISWTPVTQEDVLLLVSSSHPLAEQESVDLADFRNDRFICNNSGFGILEAGEAFCREAGFIQNVLFEGNEPELAEKMVAENYGVMFMSSIVYHWRMGMDIVDPPLQHIRALKIHTPQCRRTVGLARLTNHFISPSAEKFLDGMKRHFGA